MRREGGCLGRSGLRTAPHKEKAGDWAPYEGKGVGRRSEGGRCAPRQVARLAGRSGAAGVRGGGGEAGGREAAGGQAGVSCLATGANRKLGLDPLRGQCLRRASAELPSAAGTRRSRRSPSTAPRYASPPPPLPQNRAPMGICSRPGLRTTATSGSGSGRRPPPRFITPGDL